MRGSGGAHKAWPRFCQDPKSGPLLVVRGQSLARSEFEPCPKVNNDACGPLCQAVGVVVALSLWQSPFMPKESRYSLSDARKMALSLDLPKPIDDDLLEQLRVGMGIEREHDDLTGGDMHASAVIAAAHLREDRYYYLPLLALERFRNGQAQAPKVEAIVDYDNETQSSQLVLKVQGLAEPLTEAPWRRMPAQAEVLASFLNANQALAIVYAWMLLQKRASR